jgi:very-short-patch-repair endonuclease
MILPYDKALKPKSRQLRSNLTDAEQKLWQHLCRKQINGWQFYRQKPLGPYIVDFYCAAARLVVELDGSQHFEPEHQEADRKRDEYLRGLGLTVLRFDNRQVLLEMEAVLEVIRQIPPGPPFSKGGVAGTTRAPAKQSAIAAIEKDQPSVPVFEKGHSSASSLESTCHSIPPLKKDHHTLPSVERDHNTAPPFEKGRNTAPPIEKGHNTIPPFEKGGLGGINQNQAPAIKNKS